MSEENKKENGQLFHTEIRSTDPGATSEFLNKAFGWSVTDTPHPSYKLFDTPGGFEGHIGPVPDSDGGPSATNYILVDDIAAAEKAVADSGGTIIGERQEAPKTGYYTWFEAPGGIKMVIWQNISA